MKHRIITSTLAVLCFFLSHIVMATPAKPGKIQITQPDGTTIQGYIHGDEWFHYVTDADGNILEENASGFMVKSKSTMAEIKLKMAKAQSERIKYFTAQKQPSRVITTGGPKIPVILVQFSDRSFKISDPKSAFTALLTERGYSANGATGSVLDYYIDQSRGKYKPQFVVMDVVTLSGKMSDYGTTNTDAAKALYEACRKLDDSVDFSQFDNDSDGQIDMTLLYYAGYNEAEGGPAATIWPHAYYVPYVVTDSQPFDGVMLNRYFCTSELKGTSGTNMCGIGTTCHEFAHSLGLPDFYDTDANDYGDGHAGGTYSYDVMCGGNYNNNGRTPPWMNAEELLMLGWIDEISELAVVGNASIPSIGAAQPVAYKTPTSADGEYFLYECRPGTGWDAPLKAGLLVYHVDKSKDHDITWKNSSGTHTQTAYSLWVNHASTNAVNCNGSHPCFYVVPSGNPSSLYYSGTSFTFPGPSNVTGYTPVDWSGSETGFSLSGISFNSSTQTVSFRLSNTNQCGICGVIMDSNGSPISGVTVTVRKSIVSSAPVKGDGSMLMAQFSELKASGAVIATAITDASGYYDIYLDNAGTYMLDASKSGYVTKSSVVDVNKLITKNFYILREGEEAPSDIYIYDDGASWGYYGIAGYVWNELCANRYPASMMGVYAGKQIKSISFAVEGKAGVTTGDVHALIDFGEQRVACVKVDNPVMGDWTTVDLSKEELIIPEGKDVYAGYAISSWTYGFPFMAYSSINPDVMGYWIPSSDLSASTWNTANLVFKIKLTIGDYIRGDVGYNFIRDPRNGSYSLGDKLDLYLIPTEWDRRPNANGVKWYYDDEPVSGSVTFRTPGLHTIGARFTTIDGQQMFVEHEVNVK